MDNVARVELAEALNRSSSSATRGLCVEIQSHEATRRVAVHQLLQQIIALTMSLKLTPGTESSNFACQRPMNDEYLARAWKSLGDYMPNTSVRLRVMKHDYTALECYHEAAAIRKEYWGALALHAACFREEANEEEAEAEQISRPIEDRTGDAANAVVTKQNRRMLLKRLVVAIDEAAQKGISLQREMAYVAVLLANTEYGAISINKRQWQLAQFHNGAGDLFHTFGGRQTSLLRLSGGGLAVK